MSKKHYMQHSTDLSRDQRKALVHQLHLKIPSHDHAKKAIRACLTGSGYSAEPKSLFIGGDTGIGKSTLIREFVSRYPRMLGDEVDQISIVVASIPAVATTKSTASTLLRALGDPRAFTGELAKLTDRLLDFLVRCQVRMIILDEFQHIIDRESLKVRATTADWLKTIVEGARIPLVLVGLPHSEDILSENLQLDRRFHRRVRLSRFAWDSSRARAEFRVLLKVLDQNLPFPLTAGLDEPRTAAWIFRRTKGILALVMSLIREAAELAIDRGAPCIEKEDLEAAHELIRGAQLASDKPAPVPRSHRRSISEVLRT